MHKLISIIVPVYNVSKYLSRCLDSIIGQTYKNLEIIVIDDGSSDGSAAICDEYSYLDTRIVTIHQNNSGLSAARNKGIELAKGEFFIFVDSDDWVHPRMVELLVNNVIENNCKIAICENKRVKDFCEFNLDSNEIEVLDKDEAILRMLGGEWISAWAKIYHRSLFDNVRFPLGRINEDYAILIYLFEQCEKLVYNRAVLYYYFYRENSISNSSLGAREFDMFTNAVDVYEHCKKINKRWANIAEVNVLTAIINLSGRCVLEDPLGRFSLQYQLIEKYARTHFLRFLLNPHISFKYYPFLISILLGRKINFIVHNLYKRK